MTLTANNTDAELRSAGYDVSRTRYVDKAHGIDWAVINWTCLVCGDYRWAPGPGEPPTDEHGELIPVFIDAQSLPVAGSVRVVESEPPTEPLIVTDEYFDELQQRLSERPRIHWPTVELLRRMRGKIEHLGNDGLTDSERHERAERWRNGAGRTPSKAEMQEIRRRLSGHGE